MTLQPGQDSLALARTIVDAAADKKADNVLLLDLRGLSSVADYFVVCSGASERQLKAIADGINERVRADMQVTVYKTEGLSGGGWVLVDYGDVIAHIFAPSMRAYYNLEALWAKAPVLLRMQ